MKIDIHVARNGQKLAVANGHAEMLPDRLAPYNFLETSDLPDAWMLEAGRLSHVLEALECCGYFQFPRERELPVTMGGRGWGDGP